MKKNWILLVILSVFIGMFSGCNSKKTQIVARAGNSLISLEQFEREYLESNSIRSLQNASGDDKQKFLDKMIDKEMKLMFAKQMNIDKIPEVKDQIEQARLQAAYIAALEQLVMFKIIKEKEIREFYDRSDKEIRVRHILLDLPSKDDADSLTKVVEKAAGIIRELRSGGDFTELAGNYSKDEFSSKKGGDLGFLKWGSMDNKFMTAVLKSGKYQIYPQPIITSKGVHIIQVTEKRPVLQRPYEIERTVIVRNLFNRKRKSVTAEFEKFNQELDKKYNVVIFEENIQKMLTFISTSPNDSLLLENYGVKNPDYSWVSYELRFLPLAQYDKETKTMIGFFELMFNQQRALRPQEIRTVEIATKFLQDKIRFDLTSEIGIRHGYLEIPNYRRQLDSQVSQIITRYLQNSYINKIKKITDEMAEEYYNNQPEKYKIPAKAEVQEIFVKDSTEAQLIYQLATAGNDFDVLAEKYNTRARSKNKKGNLGYLTENSFGELGKTAIELKPGKIAGPLKLDNGYSIFRVLSHEKEQMQLFSKIKTKVRSDLVRDLRKTNQEEWEKKIKGMVRVRVYEKVLERALKQHT